MDTGRYQSLLEAPLLPQPTRQGSGGSSFQEREYRESHPCRRFFTRFLAYRIVDALFWCILIMKRTA